MSRIRSIHPGLATDENYMALSHVAARVLPLLWCECDDQGIFEWKPLTLKAKILPAHNNNMEEVLTELEYNDFVKRFTSNGKSYGAVRNFCRFQRPKKPKFTHPIEPELRTYTGINTDGSPPVENQSGNSSADGGGRMEDEGGKRSDVEKSNSRRPRTRSTSLNAEELQEFEAWYAEYPKHESRGHAEQAFVKARKIASLPELIEGAKRYAARVDRSEGGRFIKQPSTWLNAKCWLDGVANSAGPGPELEFDPVRSQWQARLKGLVTRNFWLSDWGPRPPAPNCHVPAAILAEWKPKLEALNGQRAPS